MKSGGVIESLTAIHLQVIHSGITRFRELKEEALAASKMLGYEKGINIFLFPTFHDIILIDFSVI
jgi:hypothetical protein